MCASFFSYTSDPYEMAGLQHDLNTIKAGIVPHMLFGQLQAYQMDKI